jgi:hypothetical protein
MGADELGAAPVRHTFVASCALYLELLEPFQAGMATHGAAIMANIPNHTNPVPQIEITVVAVG